MAEINKEIDSFVKGDKDTEGNEGETLKRLTQPVCAFITFESDDGYNEALEYS